MQAAPPSYLRCSGGGRPNTRGSEQGQTDPGTGTILHQNIPNPFDESTIIPYTLGEEGLVNLVIFGERGEMLETLVNEVQKPGPYKVKWNAQHISSGVYICSLSVNNTLISTRMIKLD